jgi:peptidyl-tRNA hydrolase, PTH1 family
LLLVIGLGNPGKQYEQHRHNVGFMVLDALAAKHCATFQSVSKHQSFCTEITLKDNGRVLLAKPQTYMNLSGQAAASLCQYYKIPTTQVWVIHDDLDLELGRIKVKPGGGNGGHNGLKSLDACIGTDYHRIRFGIGRPAHKDMVSDYVLSPFDKEQRIVVERVIGELVEKGMIQALGIRH